jgi:DNA mismatch repair protein MutS2
MEARLRTELEGAYGSAREIIQGARREVNAILDEARREKSREAKRKLEEAEAAVAERQRALTPEDQLSLNALKEGDTVFVRSIGYDGTVTTIDRRQGRLRVRAGSMDLDVALADLAPRQGKAPQPRTAPRRPAGEETRADQLNLIGHRVDDALAELDRFLNHASLESAGELRIVHGKGTGALMRAVRAELDGHPLVREFRRGTPEEGGDGVTVVTLR